MSLEHIRDLLEKRRWSDCECNCSWPRYSVVLSIEDLRWGLEHSGYQTSSLHYIPVGKYDADIELDRGFLPIVGASGFFVSAGVVLLSIQSLLTLDTGHIPSLSPSHSVLRQECPKSARLQLLSKQLNLAHASYAVETRRGDV